MTTVTGPSHTQQPDAHAEKERLSAWLDGELRGEQARFFAKRVEHDTALQDHAQRWSLAGELLREGSMRDLSSQAPHSFLDRVRVAIDQERALESERGSLAGAYPQAGAAAVQAASPIPIPTPTAARRMAWVRRINRPAAIAASMTLAVSAMLMSHFGMSGAEPVTSLAMQKVTLPEIKARNAATQRANSSRNRRVVAANTASRPGVRNPAAARVGVTVNRQVPLQSVAAASSAVPVLPVSATAASNAPASGATRRTISAGGAALNAAVKPTVVASKSDPFGVGSNLDSRILSGKPWPRASVTGMNNRVMNASFSPDASAAGMPQAMSLGVQRPN